MAMDLIKGSVSKSGLIATPKGRLLYPDLFKATLMKGETDNSRAAFRATLMFPKSANLDILLKSVHDTAKAEWGEKPNFKVKKPFLKTEEMPRLADLADAFPVFIRLSTRQAPAIVFANMTPCVEESEVYGGRWAVASVNPGKWDHKTGGKGISFYMSHVMLLDHDEPVGSSRAPIEDVFEGVEGDDGAPATSSAGLFD